MPQGFIIVIIAGAALLVMVGISFLSGHGSLDSIKAKPVGNGQHGTARWATPKEIDKTFAYVPFRPAEWRKGMNRPKVQRLVMGSLGKKNKITALVDSDDVHCLMIGAAGVGKTAFFLYPNLEYACACGMSFLALDTKVDLIALLIPEYCGKHRSFCSVDSRFDGIVQKVMALGRGGMVIQNRWTLRKTVFPPRVARRCNRR